MTELPTERHGEEQPAEDVIRVEITGDAAALLAQFDQLRSVLQTAAAAWVKAAVPAMRALAAAAADAQQASQSEYALAPERPRPRRTARPAWQSPYGPPPPRAHRGLWTPAPIRVRSRHCGRISARRA
jgi:hypothetical protein